MKTYNINYQVKVKLTAYGVSCLYKNYLKDVENSQGFLRRDGFHILLDDQGYYRTQLWCLMQEFGAYMAIGMNRLPFETEIILVEDAGQCASWPQQQRGWQRIGTNNAR